MDELTQMRWFGESWGAPVNELRRIVVPRDPSPPCAGCDKPLLPVERGLALYGGNLKVDDPHLFVVDEIPSVGYHIDCILFGVLGRGTSASFPGRVGTRTIELGRLPSDG